MGVCYSDNSISIYSSMLGDALYYINDEEFEFPFTGLCWKPMSAGNSSSKSESGVQSFKAVGSDGRICMWRSKYGNSLKTLLVSETNSYQCIDYS
jgi:hypothetical protein